MKKLLFVLIFLIPILTFSQSKITFKEQDREFTISTYGGLEFSYFSGDKISYDFNGNPTKVGPVYISNDFNGNPTKIGKVYISYNFNGQPTKIGGLRINYDFEGRVTSTSGSVK
jgi:hypothetical protein